MSEQNVPENDKLAEDREEAPPEDVKQGGARAVGFADAECGFAKATG